MLYEPLKKGAYKYKKAFTNLAENGILNSKVRF